VASTSERKKLFEFSTTRRNSRWQWTSRLIASVCEKIVAHLEVLSMCSNLMNILRKERWKLLKKGLSIHTASVWIKCQMMHSWKKILRNSVQIVLLKCNFRVKLGRVLVLGYDYVSKTLWNCTSCAHSICEIIPIRRATIPSLFLRFVLVLKYYVLENRTVLISWQCPYLWLASLFFLIFCSVTEVIFYRQ